MTTPADFLTTAQVADRLGVDTRTVLRLAKDGTIRPATKLPGPTGAYLFDPAEVAAYEAGESGGVI